MDEPLNIVICEDSPEDAQRLLDILADSSIPNKPVLYHSGEELLEHFAPMQYDLLLSDIYMGGMTGVETVTRIRQTDEQIPVAFITSSSEFALESYRLSALKYIEKPFKPREIEDILQLAKMKRDSAPALLIQQGGQELAIRYSQIVYLEQQTHHLTIVTQDGHTYTLYDKLSALIPGLEENGFFSPHKSFSVNLSYVCRIDTEFRCFVMPDGKNIPIRRESMGKARRAYEAQLFNTTREDS